MGEKIINESLQGIKHGKFLGVEGESKIYEIKGNPTQVLVSFDSKVYGKTPELRLAYAKHLMLTHQKVPKSVGLARISRVGMLNNNVNGCMERIKGDKAHDLNEHYNGFSKRLSSLATIPSKHYQKLIKDQLILHANYLGNNSEKPNTILYNNQGFFFINLLLGDHIGSHVPSFINSKGIFTYFKRAISPENRKHIFTIVKKLQTAGDSINENFVTELRDFLEGRTLV